MRKLPVDAKARSGGCWFQRVSRFVFGRAIGGGRKRDQLAGIQALDLTSGSDLPSQEFSRGTGDLQRSHEFLNRKPSLGNKAAKCATSHFTMVWY